MTKKTKIIGLLILIIIISIGVLNTSNKTGKTKIGVISVLSGEYATLGENFDQGIRLAQKEYNLKNPADTVDIVIEDDAFSGTKGLSAYKKLTDLDKVSGLIIATSPTINTIYEDVSKQNIPVITYGSQSEEEKDDNVFHIYPSSVPVLKGLGEYVNSISTSTTSGVVLSAFVTNDSTILKFYNAFKKEYSQPIDEHLVSDSSKDVKSDVAKLLSKNPEYVLMTNFVNVGGEAVKQILIQTKNTHRPIFVFDLTFNEAMSEYQKRVGDLKQLNGSIVASLKGHDSSDFVSKFKAEYGKDPGQLADFGYDAFNLIVKSKDKNGTKWISNLSKISLSGASGDIHFDNEGRRLPEYKITKLLNGKVPEYDSIK